MESLETNGHWHLDKRVSVGHLATTLLVVATFAYWLMTIDKKVELNAGAISEIRLDDEIHASIASDQMKQIEARFSAQTARIEGRMETQYNEIIRRLEILDQRLADHSFKGNGVN